MGVNCYKSSTKPQTLHIKPLVSLKAFLVKKNKKHKNQIKNSILHQNTTYSEALTSARENNVHPLELNGKI